jgi:YidC/Oxa1 family membrane protein insertase
MEKKTIVAVVLAVAVIIGSLLVQSLFFPRETPPAAPAPTEAPQAQPPQAQAPPAQLEQAPPAAQTAPPQQEVQPAPEKALQEETIPVETQVFLARFTNRGGELVSLELKDFKNPDGSNVNMVFSQKSGISPFNIRFGDTNAPMVNALFDYERSLTGPGVTFFRTFLSPSGVPFTLR